MSEVEQSLDRDSTIEGNDTELRACAECTLICHSLHWRKNDLHPPVFRFFKIMLGQDWNKVLLLPPNCTAIVTDLVDKETELENANGEKWTVTLSSSSNGLAFQRGWEDFVSDHKLNTGDFLVFNYIKGSHFIVHIFGRSGCEKNCNGSFKGNRCKGNVSSQTKPSEKKNMDATKRLSVSASVAPGTKFEPSATNRTQHSGGKNVKFPRLDNFCDVSYVELYESKHATDSKKSIDAGEDTSNLAHTGMRLQSEANKDFIATENFNSDILTKVTNVRITEKVKHLEFTDDRTRKCEKGPWGANLANRLPLGPSREELGKEGNNHKLELKDDRTVECKNKLLAEFPNRRHLGPSCVGPGRKGDGASQVCIQRRRAGRRNRNYGNELGSPCANEGAVFKNNGRNTAGDLKKMVKKEQQERSEQVHGHAKRRRDDADLESSPHRITNFKQVKTEPLDERSSYEYTVTCLAVSGERLNLTEMLPAVRFKKRDMESKTVLLRDRKRRVWPALYQKGSGFHVLISDWDKVNREIGIQAGDSYVFGAEDAFECVFTIDVQRQ